MYIIYTNIMDINAVGKEPAERERMKMHLGEGMIESFVTEEGRRDRIQGTDGKIRLVGSWEM